MKFGGDDKLESFENRILYELILGSQKNGVCTLAVDSDEEIIGITINRFQKSSADYKNRVID